MRSAGFNGATSFQKWKLYNEIHNRVRTSCVSMEPLLFRNGNFNSYWLLFISFAEMVSMEPLLFRNGNTLDICLQSIRLYGHVSMEPLLFRNGNSGFSSPGSARKRSFNGATSFQKWK